MHFVAVDCTCNVHPFIQIQSLHIGRYLHRTRLNGTSAFAFNVTRTLVPYGVLYVH